MSEKYVRNSIEIIKAFKKAPEHTLFTACSEEDAFCIMSPFYCRHFKEPEFVKLETYSSEEYEKIRKEADDWIMKRGIAEGDYDSYSNIDDMYENLGGCMHYDERTPEDINILVKNGKLFGIVILHISGNPEVRFGCIDDYSGEELLLYEHDNLAFVGEYYDYERCVYIESFRIKKVK